MMLLLAADEENGVGVDYDGHNDRDNDEDNQFKRPDLFSRVYFIKYITILYMLCITKKSLS